MSEVDLSDYGIKETKDGYDGTDKNFMPMYNPDFEKCYRMVENLCAKHVGEITHAKLRWEWLLDDFGNKAQPVPLLDIHFKF